MDRDASNALIRAHQNNIDRYCRLLATYLTDHEREYVHRRIAEERLELERLLKNTKAGMIEQNSTPPAPTTMGPSYTDLTDAVT